MYITKAKKLDDLTIFFHDCYHIIKDSIKLKSHNVKK